MSEINLPMKWDGRHHHVFDSKGNSFAYLLRNTHRDDYDQWDRDGRFITKAINEHATLTAQPAESIPELMQAYAEQYATKHLERQTPAIIERFVEEVKRKGK